MTNEHAPQSSSAVRPLLWVLLVISLTGNAVTSTAGVNVAISAGFGAVALACIVGLIVHHYQHRRR
jgi:hypothetical protein